LFCLSLWDLQNHNGFSHTLGTVGKRSMSRLQEFYGDDLVILKPKCRTYWILSKFC
jgi:hypothetical protein